MCVRTKLIGINHIAASQRVWFEKTSFFGIIVGHHGDAATVEIWVLFHDASRDGKQGIRVGESLLKFPAAVTKCKLHIFKRMFHSYGFDDQLHFCIPFQIGADLLASGILLDA